MALQAATPEDLHAASREALRHRWLGAAGATALSVASAWAGALPVFHPLSDWFEPQSAGTLAAAAFGYAGLIVLVTSWWRLGCLTASGPAVSGHEMVVTLCWWAAPLALGAPMFSRDVYSYVAQGAMAARGWDVYAGGPSSLPGPISAGVDWLWRDTPAPYGPVFVWLAAHVLRLTGEHVLAAVVGMRILAVSGFALIVWAVRRLAVAAGRCEAGALWLAVLNPLALVHLVGGAHNDAVMLGLMLCGLVLARRGRLAWGAVLITLAMLVKVPSGFALLFLIPPQIGGRGGPLRRAAVVAAAAAATTVVTTAVLGYGYGWLSALGTPATSPGLLSLTADAGNVLGALLGPLGLAAPLGVAAAIRTAGVAAAVVALPFWLWRMPRLGPERALGAALLTVVVLAPAVQPWYFLWGLLPIAVTAPGGRTRARLAAASVGLVFVVFLRGQAPGAAYAACCCAGVAAALVTLYRFDPVAGSTWRLALTHRRSVRRLSRPARDA
ncbi:polyprenol phosphomannose-dependent alpha 1,6 mannosyltransferase MptB [Streptomyces sp. NBC_01476]|uniref:polyprenol phosphomannose-dependent alpha 1,6 mannosyltransferase MptB n=1 Tax=Streptomyces sp. NBC_01476 TaxID=2903881 RepID=UPI002E3425FA|nr:polyprenol phosphomannose-dependent alpha 1,6 mannosyltransferase MptB [Streptomyces sp. NBC_01476]